LPKPAPNRAFAAGTKAKRMAVAIANVTRAIPAPVRPPPKLQKSWKLLRPGDRIKYRTDQDDKYWLVLECYSDGVTLRTPLGDEMKLRDSNWASPEAGWVRVKPPARRGPHQPNGGLTYMGLRKDMRVRSTASGRVYRVARVTVDRYTKDPNGVVLAGLGNDATDPKLTLNDPRELSHLVPVALES
jgi:hypothetical protein